MNLAPEIRNSRSSAGGKVSRKRRFKTTTFEDRHPEIIDKLREIIVECGNVSVPQIHDILLNDLTLHPDAVPCLAALYKVLYRSGWRSRTAWEFVGEVSENSDKAPAAELEVA